jgi:hypothetical protein
VVNKKTFVLVSHIVSIVGESPEYHYQITNFGESLEVFLNTLKLAYFMKCYQVLANIYVLMVCLTGIPSVTSHWNLLLCSIQPAVTSDLFFIENNMNYPSNALP